MIVFAVLFGAAIVMACTAMYMGVKYQLRDFQRQIEQVRDSLVQHAMEHVKTQEETANTEEEIAARIAAQIEKKWDDGLNKMLAWNPFDVNGSDDG